jgi:hypothetical protein
LPIGRRPDPTKNADCRRPRLSSTRDLRNAFREAFLRAGPRLQEDKLAS